MVKREDIIVFDNFSEKEYDDAIKQAVSYGILSVPYTYDRFHLGNSIRGIRERIRRIAKGKLAEKLFELYCNVNGVPISKKETETPFWRYDKKDFEINGVKFDLKNNFLTKGNGIVTDEVLDFPALIPVDQYKENTGYIFSFMKGRDAFELNLSDDVIYEISQYNNGCCGKELDHKPEYFINVRQYYLDMFAKYGRQKVVDIRYYPEMIICGLKYPNDTIRNLFKVAPEKTVFQYNFGQIETHIKNYVTPVRNLYPVKF